MHQQNTVNLNQSSFTFSSGELDSLRGKLQTAEEQMSGFHSKNAQYIMQLSLNETRTLQKMVEMTYLQGLCGTGYPSIQQKEQGMKSSSVKSYGNSPPSNYVCHKCGVEGHYVYDCPNVIGKGPPPENYVCRKCNIQGHWIDECPLGNQQGYKDYSKPPPLGYCCYRCGVSGHWIKNCPTNEERTSQPRAMSTYRHSSSRGSHSRSSGPGHNTHFSNRQRVNSQTDPTQNMTYVKKSSNFNEI